MSTSTLAIPPMTIFEVYNALLQLKLIRARGPNDLDGKIMKMRAHVTSDTVTNNYTQSLHRHLQKHLDS